MYSKKDCLNAIQRVNENTTDNLTRRKYERQRKYKEPSDSTIINKFDSWNKAKKCSNIDRYGYTRKDIIKAIRRVSNKLDKSPLRPEYNNHKRDDEPSPATIRRYFETWNQAKQEAGLSINKTNQPKYSKQHCVDSLRHISDKIGHSPSKSEYREHRTESEPSIKAIKNQIGSWNRAKQQAGLGTKKVGGVTKYSEQDCVDALKKTSNEIGHSPSIPEYRENRTNSEPSVATIGKKIGSFNKAKQQAGLETRGYSEQDCVDALQRVAKQLGYSPSNSEYREHRTNSEPTGHTICSRMGSWNEAKQQAGIETRLSNRDIKYTDEDCVDGLQRVANEIGHSPSQSEYKEHHTDSEPSQTLIQSEFGSWNEAKKQAGLETRGYSKENCLDALNRVADKIGHSPSLSEYKKHYTDSEPSRRAIENNFISWNRAKQQAGIGTKKVGGETKYSEKECLDALQRVAHKIGHSPSQIEYTEHHTDSEPTKNTIIKKSDSWNEAKRMCSLATYNDGNGVSYPYGSSWYSSRKQVLKRDKECIACGMSSDEHIQEYGRTLDVHHIHKLRSFYSDLSDKEIEKFENDEVPERLRAEVEKRTQKANHTSNLVTLCRECHLKEIEPLSVEEQVELLGIEMPEYHRDNLN